MNKSISHILILLAAGLAAAAPVHAESAGLNRRITLNVANGDIRDALRLVAEQGGLNISIGPGVEGEVSVFLTDASLEGALEAIARHNGYDYRVEKDIISVSKPPGKTAGNEVPPLETRVFFLRSQDAERVRDALEFSLSPFGRMKVLNENSTDTYATQSLSQLSGDLAGSTSGNGTAVTTNANFAQGAQVNGGQIGPFASAQAITARNARHLVVTDVAENLDRIAELVDDLDKMPAQVQIDAHIVEISTDLQKQLGIDWNTDILANGPILNHELPLAWEAGFASGNQIRRTPQGAAQASAGLALGTIDFSRFTALLRIHESDNAIRLLAKPRLLVFNNHPGSILVGERYPILRSNITDFGTVTESFDTYIPVGIQLEVTPTIMADGRLSMLVHPVTSTLGDDVVGTTGLRVARIRTRELSTRVIMGDGQTIVLGGLISDRKTRQVNKVPGLGDLWGLSVLFRQENPRSERVDLLVFLTARVEGGAELTERDREILEMYQPHFRMVPRLQDVQLHFEVPTEYAEPKPLYGDPVDMPSGAPDDCDPLPAGEFRPGTSDEPEEFIQAAPAPTPPARPALTPAPDPAAGSASAEASSAPQDSATHPVPPSGATSMDHSPRPRASQPTPTPRAGDAAPNAAGTHASARQQMSGVSRSDAAVRPPSPTIHANQAVSAGSAPATNRAAVGNNAPASLNHNLPAPDTARMKKLQRTKRQNRDNAVRKRNAANGGLLMVGGLRQGGSTSSNVAEQK